eukprot:gene15163-23159_t
MFTTPEEPFGPQNRPRRERYLKWVNLVVFIFTFLAFCMLVATVDQKASQSLDDFWIAGGLDLQEHLTVALGNCSHSSKLRLGDYSFEFTMNADTRATIMAYSAGLIRQAVWITGAATVVTGVNKLLFDRGVHELTLFNGLFALNKGLLLTIEIVLVVWSISALQAPQETAYFINDYITACAKEESHIWEAPPFILMYVAHGITLLTHLMTWFILLQHSTPDSLTNYCFPLVRKEFRRLHSIMAVRKTFQGEPSEVERTSIKLLVLLKREIALIVEGPAGPRGDGLAMSEVGYPMESVTSKGYPDDDGAESLHTFPRVYSPELPPLPNPPVGYPGSPYRQALSEEGPSQYATP